MWTTTYVELVLYTYYSSFLLDEPYILKDNVLCVYISIYIQEYYNTYSLYLCNFMFNIKFWNALN